MNYELTIIEPPGSFILAIEEEKPKTLATQQSDFQIIEILTEQFIKHYRGSGRYWDEIFIEPDEGSTLPNLPTGYAFTVTDDNKYIVHNGEFVYVEIA